MTTVRLTAAVFVLLAVGCAHKRPQPEPSPELTAARVRAPHEVVVSDDIKKACNIEDAKMTPKFDYDESDLLPADRDVLAKVARCLTTGPLKGRAIDLVGRADPRGETEYNMVLGESRADSVDKYLADLGVDAAKMNATSRGELDAEGTDDETWKLDRRVDLRLQDSSVSQLAIDKP